VVPELQRPLPLTPSLCHPLTVTRPSPQASGLEPIVPPGPDYPFKSTGCRSTTLPGLLFSSSRQRQPRDPRPPKTTADHVTTWPMSGSGATPGGGSTRLSHGHRRVSQTHRLFKLHGFDWFCGDKNPASPRSPGRTSPAKAAVRVPTLPFFFQGQLCTMDNQTRRYRTVSEVPVMV